MVYVVGGGGVKRGGVNRGSCILKLRLTTKIPRKFFVKVSIISPEPFSFEDFYHKRFLSDVVRIEEVELGGGSQSARAGWGGILLNKLSNCWRLGTCIIKGSNGFHGHCHQYFSMFGEVFVVF